MTQNRNAGVEPAGGSSASDSDGPVGKHRGFLLLFLLCVGLVVLADVFFYQQPMGWTIGGYGLILMLAVIFCEGSFPRGRVGVLVTTALAVLFLSCCEEPNRLTIVLGLLGLVSLALVLRESWSADALVWIKRWTSFVLTGWLTPFREVNSSYTSREREGGGDPGLRFFRNWSIPVSLSLIFASLFAIANPVISDNLRRAWDSVVGFAEALPSFERTLMWLLVGVWSWALLRFRSGITESRMVASAGSGLALGEFPLAGLIVRCLIPFNLLFLVQTALDVAYLWSGAELPRGLTHAQYAHRGAYPLVAAALLAALFVVMTFRTGLQDDKMRWARRLVYFWLVQNIFLVISSGQRICLYVEAYSLTRWRVAAALWMFLITCGFIWILVRIASGRTNHWLFNVNVLTTLVVLYACSFVDFDGGIADFNVRRCEEVRGAGPSIDLAYLESLGPDTLPGLVWLSERLTTSSKFPAVDDAVARLQAGLQQDMRNWRGWTWRRHRLMQMSSAIESLDRETAEKL